MDFRRVLAWLFALGGGVMLAWMLLAIVAVTQSSAADYNDAEDWFARQPHVEWAVCDSTPTWQGRKFPIYCWIGYESGRWSDYRVRISHHGAPYYRRISTGVWLVD